MQLVQRLRRLGPAFLAALVLVASLASAGHAHAVGTGDVTLQSTTEAGASVASDLDCALCAHAQRLGHAAFSAKATPAPLSHRHLDAGSTDHGAIQRIALDLSEARSPPRHG